MNSSYINHFIQPDSIIPDYTNPQTWNRYSYVRNNPINFNDPTGHKAWSENEGFDERSCSSGDLVCNLKQGGYEPKTKEEIAEDLHLERPVFGVHLGASGQGGILGELGAYGQIDFLMDWKQGTFYRVGTFGVFSAGGTPGGLTIEGYGGVTNIHGIPLYGEDDISDYLAGKNIDGAVSVGGDIMLKASATKGVSVDLDKSLHPVHTGAGFLGYQYAIENSIEAGTNAIPNGIDVSLEGGMSDSWVISKHQISWWPR